MARIVEPTGAHGHGSFRQLLCKTGQPLFARPRGPYAHRVNVVIYLPKNFYAGVAACVTEILLAVNAVQHRPTFVLHFVSQHRRAATRAGITFPVTQLGARKIDLLIIHVTCSSASTGSPPTRACRRRDSARRRRDRLLRHGDHPRRNRLPRCAAQRVSVG